MRKNNILNTLTGMAICAVGLGTVCSCNGNNKDESGGYECISQARQFLSTGNYDKARTMIDTLRNNYPLAFNAREEGILLLDSIEIASAQKDLQNVIGELATAKVGFTDSLQFAKEEAEQKIKFYTKKLNHDKANFKKHK